MEGTRGSRFHDRPVGLGAMLRAPELEHNNWRLERVDEDVAILSFKGIATVVPLVYIEAVYQAGEPEAECPAT